MLLSVCIPVACKLGILNPFYTFVTWHYLKRLQLWRLVSAFFYSSVNLKFLFSLFTRYNYLNMLEMESFAGEEEELIFFLLFSAVMMLSLGLSLFGIGVYWNCMNICIVYLWSRLNANREVSFMFGIRFKAFYLPFATSLVELISGDLYSPLIAIVVGHLYYFGRYVYPTVSGGKVLLKCPRFLRNLYISMSKRVPPGQSKVTHTNPSGYTIYEPTRSDNHSNSSSVKRNVFTGKHGKVE